MFSSIKKLLAVCAMGLSVAAFSGAALARTPGPGSPGTPQVQVQKHLQVAHGRHFRRGPPAHFRRHHHQRQVYRHGRRGHGGYFRGPRFHSGFNLVLQFGDSDRRSGGGHGGGGRAKAFEVPKLVPTTYTPVE